MIRSDLKYIFQGGRSTTNKHRLGGEKGSSSSLILEIYLKNAVSPTNLIVSRTVVYSSQAVEKQKKNSWCFS